MAAVLSANYIDWNAFFGLKNLLKNSSDQDVQKEIARGMQALSKEHDKLEKPLKDMGVISGKTRNSSTNKNGRVREYSKDGGDEQLQKDFDKIEGVPSKSDDGMDVKTLSDGTRIVKRPRDGGKPSTLEVQPSKSDPRYPNSKIRIKVRY